MHLMSYRLTSWTPADHKVHQRGVRRSATNPEQIDLHYGIELRAGQDSWLNQNVYLVWNVPALMVRLSKAPTAAKGSQSANSPP